MCRLLHTYCHAPWIHADAFALPSTIPPGCGSAPGWWLTSSHRLRRRQRRWRRQESSKVIDDKLLLRIARQKIWRHWLLWLLPIVSLIGPFISGRLIRNYKPCIIVLAIVIIMAIADSAPLPYDLVVFLIMQVIGAMLTQMQIQQARFEVDLRRMCE